LSTYRTEKESAVREVFAKLVEKGWDIDLSFVDWKESIDQVIEHETLDHSEADGSPESIMLADLRGVLRAVYLNGELVIQIEDLAEEEKTRNAILKMANRGDSRISYCSSREDDSPRKLSKNQARRENMITDPKQLSVGQWLMIYLNGEPSSLVKVTQVADNIITYDEYRDKFKCESGVSKLTEMGILPYAKGIWETANWVEAVDDSTARE